MKNRRRDLSSSRPFAFEPTGDPLLPDGEKENVNLKLYSAAVAEVAAERKLAFVDVFDVSLKLVTQKPGMQYTINGCHLNDAGDQEIARLIDEKAFGSASSSQLWQ
jgi:lysophospholipase L1-like esterase